MPKLQPNLDPTLYKIDGADTHSDVRSYKQEVSTEQLLKEFNAFERIDLKKVYTSKSCNKCSHPG
jgi:hypothetical protein